MPSDLVSGVQIVDRNVGAQNGTVAVNVATGLPTPSHSPSSAWTDWTLPEAPTDQPFLAPVRTLTSKLVLFAAYFVNL